jgi:hypothetical protein
MVKGGPGVEPWLREQLSLQPSIDPASFPLTGTGYRVTAAWHVTPRCFKPENGQV